MNAALLLLLMRMGPAMTVDPVGIDETVMLSPDDSECRMIQDSREVRFNFGGDSECRLAGRGGL